MKALPRDEFATHLYDSLTSHLTLDHPLVVELVKPQQNWKLLRALALQGYQLTKVFFDYVQHLYFYCPLPMHKERLLYNLFEEETGRLSKTKNHRELLHDFIRAIGISDDERDSAEPYPETRELIEYRMAAVRDRQRYHVGAAAVMIASEGQNLEKRAGQARHQLLAKVYGLAERDTRFFSVHQKEDVGHVREGVDLVADLCDSAPLQGEAVDAVNKTCVLFWKMYDGIAQRHLAA